MEKQIDILAQGRGWIGVDKPAGLSVHNDPGQDLISLLRAHLGEKIYPVHRLDRATSGVLLLAHDPKTLARLCAAFKENQVKKHYLALVHGQFETDQGRWDMPLAPGAGGRSQPAGRGKKQRAVTHYKVRAQSPHYALLDIELETGRTHQIRRHAKLSGHPVTGDARYGSQRAIRFLNEQKNFYRMGLHSSRLELNNRGDRIRLSSPSAPKEMLALMEEDRS